jgi:hypothetical protein
VIIKSTNELRPFNFLKYHIKTLQIFLVKTPIF